MSNFFGTDGVRGEVGKVLTPELAYALGRAAGQILTDQELYQTKTVVIGRDSRISGPMLEAALTAGLTSVGVHVISVGLIPTPGVAYLVRHYHATAGVVISASHNPFYDNGIKFFSNTGHKLSDQQEEAISDLVAHPEKVRGIVHDHIGTILYEKNGLKLYKDYVKSLAVSQKMGMKVVLDCANGSASAVAESLFRELGCYVKVLSDKPNGININANCGSTHPEQLQKEVLAWQADLGLAFDGDADRLIAVDHQGKCVDGDQIVAIMAEAMHKEGTLAGDQIVLTVMSNLGLKKTMEARQIKTIETKVGDRYVNEGMQANGANLGGEQSGHIILSDLNSTGDGLISAVTLLNIMYQEKKSLDELAGIMKVYPQVLKNVQVCNKKAWENDDRIQNAIRYGEEQMAGNGRILVRASGTENLLRVMVEGEDQEQINTIIERMVYEIEEAYGVICPQLD